MTELEAREEVREAGLELAASGLVEGTWGNISARVSPELMAITPSGRDYSGIKVEDIVLVDLRTMESSGGKASTETPLHAAIYRDRPEIFAIVHTHSMSASTVAAARREVPPILDDFAQIVGPSLRTADYALPGSTRMTKVVVKAMSGRMAALLANHGAVAVGRLFDGPLVSAVHFGLGRIVGGRVGRGFQRGAVFELQGEIAAQANGTGQVGARREVHGPAARRPRDDQGDVTLGEARCRRRHRQEQGQGDQSRQNTTEPSNHDSLLLESRVIVLPDHDIP